MNISNGRLLNYLSIYPAVLFLIERPSRSIGAGAMTQLRLHAAKIYRTPTFLALLHILIGIINHIYTAAAWTSRTQNYRSVDLEMLQLAKVVTWNVSPHT